MIEEGNLGVIFRDKDRVRVDEERRKRKYKREYNLVAIIFLYQREFTLCYVKERVLKIKEIYHFMKCV